MARRNHQTLLRRVENYHASVRKILSAASPVAPGASSFTWVSSSMLLGICTQVINYTGTRRVVVGLQKNSLSRIH